jgi:hypothetical protein
MPPHKLAPKDLENPASYPLALPACYKAAAEWMPSDCSTPAIL